MNSYRSANKGDAQFLVPLIAVSSAGVWPAVWKALANDGEPLEKSGARYLQNPTNKLCVYNTRIAELENNRVGALVTYQEIDLSSATPEPALPDVLISALRPYRELSDPNSLFIAELCFLPEARGQGLGTRLLEFAKESAARRGLPRVSLRVFSENTGAVRLYERSGFTVVDQRPVVSHPDINVVGSVLLMATPV